MRRLSFTLFLAALFAMQVRPCTAQTNQQLVDYLNTSFAQRIWPQVEDLVSNLIIQEIGKQVDAQGLDLDLPDTTINMNGAPGFSLAADGQTLIARFPASGRYRIVADVEAWIFSTDLTVDFHIDATIGRTSATFTPVVDVDASGLSLGPWVPTNTIRDQIIANFGNHLGFFGTLSFDPAGAYRASALRSELIHGERDLGTGALDIVLVADGFTAAQMAEFHAQAKTIAEKLVTPDPVTHVSEPFASYASSIRVWKLNLQTAGAGNAERLVTSFLDAVTGTRKTALANLARLARAGIETRALGADVVAFVSRPVGSVTPRASAFGDLVLLPVTAPLDTEAATVFIHELGHTVLGNLADEYVDDKRATERYASFEPANSNVSILSVSPKWLWWILNPQRREPWDAAISGFEGAYLFGQGIWRAADNCKMRASHFDVPFCAPNREAIARGIRRIVSQNLAVVEATYRHPWTAAASKLRIASSASTATRRMEVFGGGGTTEVRLRLLAASRPSPSTLLWTYTPPAGGQTVPRTSTASDVTFRVEPNARLALRIATQNRFTPREAWANYTITFVFDVLKAPIGNPAAPTGLRQTPVVGSSVPVTYDPATGNVRFDLEISAVNGGYTGWSVPTSLEFQINGPQSRTVITAPSVVGTRLSHRPPVLSAGYYTWRVRTRYGAAASAWVALPRVLQFDGSVFRSMHFRVLAPAHSTTPTAPVAPVNLGASGPVTIGGNVPRVIQLVASSWDLNADNLRFEFEVKPQAAAYNGLGTLFSPWLAPRIESLRVEGNVVVGPYIDTHKWRVRAVDTTGRASVWVNGGLISSQIQTPVDIAPIDERLEGPLDPIFGVNPIGPEPIWQDPRVGEDPLRP
jgi:hypothetical protein